MLSNKEAQQGGIGERAWVGPIGQGPPARADLQAGALGKQERDGLKVAVRSRLQNADTRRLRQDGRCLIKIHTHIVLSMLTGVMFRHLYFRFQWQCSAVLGAVIEV